MKKHFTRAKIVYKISIPTGNITSEKYMLWIKYKNKKE